jgi:hypothetical protein
VHWRLFCTEKEVNNKNCFANLILCCIGLLRSLHDVQLEVALLFWEEKQYVNVYTCTAGCSHPTPVTCHLLTSRPAWRQRGQVHCKRYVVPEWTYVCEDVSSKRQIIFVIVIYICLHKSMVIERLLFLFGTDISRTICSICLLVNMSAFSTV